MNVTLEEGPLAGQEMWIDPSAWLEGVVRINVPVAPVVQYVSGDETPRMEERRYYTATYRRHSTAFGTASATHRWKYEKC